MPRKCPGYGRGVGGNPGTSGSSRPGVCVIPQRSDRMCAGQTGQIHRTGHVHRMVAIQQWRCPAKFLYVYCCFVSSQLSFKSVSYA